MSKNKENKQSKHTAHKVFNILCPIIAVGGLAGGGVMLYLGLTAKSPSTPTPAQITVNFGATEGGSISYVDTKVVKDCKWKDCPRPTAVANDSYCFIGWFKEDNKSITDDETVTDGMKITAHFEKQSVKEDTTVTATDGTNSYELDMNTLCSSETTTKIKATNIATKEVSEINRYDFDMEVHIGKDIIWISDNFLKGCTGLNHKVIFNENSKLTYVGESFLEDCSIFDQPLTLPDSVRYISSAFMYQCTNFNSTLTLSNNLYAISTDFMNECHNFNQPLTIPKSVKYVSTSFMFNCLNYTNTITMDYTDAAWETDICTLSTDKGDPTHPKPCYETGITLAGQGIDDFLIQFKNLNDNPYRKLIKGA